VRGSFTGTFKDDEAYDGVVKVSSPIKKALMERKQFILVILEETNVMVTVK